MLPEVLVDVELAAGFESEELGVEEDEDVLDDELRELDEDPPDDPLEELPLSRRESSPPRPRQSRPRSLLPRSSPRSPPRWSM